MYNSKTKTIYAKWLFISTGLFTLLYKTNTKTPEQNIQF